MTTAEQALSDMLGFTNATSPVWLARRIHQWYAVTEASGAIAAQNEMGKREYGKKAIELLKQHPMKAPAHKLEAVRESAKSFHSAIEKVHELSRNVKLGPEEYTEANRSYVDMKKAYGDDVAFRIESLIHVDAEQMGKLNQRDPAYAQAQKQIAGYRIMLQRFERENPPDQIMNGIQKAWHDQRLMSGKQLTHNVRMTEFLPVKHLRDAAKMMGINTQGIPSSALSLAVQSRLIDGKQAAPNETVQAATSRPKQGMFAKFLGVMERIGSAGRKVGFSRRNP